MRNRIDALRFLYVIGFPLSSERLVLCGCISRDRTVRKKNSKRLEFSVHLCVLLRAPPCNRISLERSETVFPRWRGSAELKQLCFHHSLFCDVIKLFMNIEGRLPVLLLENIGAIFLHNV
jgi:hypothetical protein